MIQILLSAVSISIPLLLASTGGLISELTGTLNIALEGLILTGAFTAYIFAHFTGSIFLGVMISLLITVLLSSIQAFVTFKLRADVFIAGIATNLLASGLITVVSFELFNNKGVLVFDNVRKLARYNFPIPSQTIFTYVAFILVIICYVVVYKSPFGMHLRCCGKNELALASMGLNPTFYKTIAYLIGGATCSLAGAMMTLSLGSYVPNISNGKGWMALVIVFLGNRNPFGLVAAALLFGLAESFSNYAQGAFQVPTDFILSIPYFFTLLAMVVFSIISHKKSKFK